MVINSKKILILILLVLLCSCEDGGVSGIDLDTTGGDSDSCDPCKIFVTAASSDGNLGGVAGADSRCASDANNPGDGTYKAYIGVDSQRDGTAGAQIDWVIKPNTQYTRTDGTLIETSDSNGLLPQDLINPVTTTRFNVFTGLSVNGVPRLENCSGWSSNSSGALAIYGLSDVIDYEWIYFSDVTCNNTTRRLYCIQQ